MNDSLPRSWKPSPIHILLWPLGAVTGLAAGAFSYSQRTDWFLAFFAFTTVTYAVGRGVPEVLTRPQKAQRAVYFAMLPLASAAVLYITYLLTNTMWLALLSWFAFGGAGHRIVARMLVPTIVDGEELSARAKRDWGEPGPHDFVPGWFRRSHNGPQ